MGSYTTLGYLQSKIIRTPLHLNSEWNKSVNDCEDLPTLLSFVHSNATISEIDQFISACNVAIEVNEFEVGEIESKLGNGYGE